ncbi:hypothetical protein [Mycolicibacterium rhodesiae]|uniref:Bacteriophage protein n=1 Tax=Mycolicibacterium rhodesiae TaxID=36814 RepID=A0A1X0IR06_MYCRH|nr:hypothetical protein [Mycolicibacterium rhodesiae]MCV7346989.1 hypothetical protein [Mycolicibacterium rhodesiae]ORB50803.1 hypothetical protein BST42_18730 [Mycolicibacterium rhodesiae]
MRGPLPKDPATRARTNSERVPFQLVEIPNVEQPDLPDYFRYEGRKIKYPARTLEWWEQWNGSPLTKGFTDHDWSYLLDTAVLHAQFWLGLGNVIKIAGELRQRLSKFGVTPADRARLRIMFVTADEAEEAKRRADELNGRVVATGNPRRLTALSFDHTQAAPSSDEASSDA